MTDLVGFLRARLDEDAADLQYSRDRVGDNWLEHPQFLYEVEVRRRIVQTCSTDVSYEEEGMANTILAIMSLPYVDHPDYDEDWRP